MTTFPPETVSGDDSDTEAFENSSIGTDVEEGFDPCDELHLTDSLCRCIFFHKGRPSIGCQEIGQRSPLSFGGCTLDDTSQTHRVRLPRSKSPRCDGRGMKKIKESNQEGQCHIFI